MDFAFFVLLLSTFSLSSFILSAVIKMTLFQFYRIKNRIRSRSFLFSYMQLCVTWHHNTFSILFIHWLLSNIHSNIHSLSFFVSNKYSQLHSAIIIHGQSRKINNFNTKERKRKFFRFFFRNNFFFQIHQIRFLNYLICNDHFKGFKTNYLKKNFLLDVVWRHCSSTFFSFKYSKLNLLINIFRWKDFIDFYIK